MVGFQTAQNPRAVPLPLSENKVIRVSKLIELRVKNEQGKQKLLKVNDSHLDRDP